MSRNWRLAADGSCDNTLVLGSPWLVAWPRLLLLLLPLLGGSWVVISGLIGRVTIVRSPIRGLTTLLITTLDPKPKPLSECERRNPKPYGTLKGTLPITHNPTNNYPNYP